uniref:Phosphatidylserine decarboxylase family protein n=1 Tax=Biomphalaria glabrata TaxID=6526 RepID=A0A2C9KVH2_BIOGL
DPKRVILKNKDVVLGPADGIVVSISGVDSVPEELSVEVDSRFIKISIFLSVFDVHVNRMPVSGIVKSMAYVPGMFSNAFYDGASFKNERQIILIENDDSEKFVVTQVAGLIARRIVCDVAVDDSISAGDRFGIIKIWQ